MILYSETVRSLSYFYPTVVKPNKYIAMKKILVPTDFSDHADLALKYAIGIAQKIQAEIVLLHVLLTPVNWVKLSKEQEDLFPDTKKSIRTARIGLDERKKQGMAIGVAISDYLIFSDGRDHIVPFIEREKIDMVIMGSHGRYGWKEHILGSNTYNVLRKSKVPVLVVKEQKDSVDFQNIVFATDFKESSGRAFMGIAQFAKTIGAELHLLYVNTPANFLEDSQLEKLAEEFLGKYAESLYPIHFYSAYNEERGIIQFIQKVNADAVAIATHGRSDLQQLFTPSVTEHLVTYQNAPVLSINLSLLA